MLPIQLRNNYLTELGFDTRDPSIEFVTRDIVVRVPPSSPFITYDASDEWYLDYARLWTYRPIKVGDRMQVDEKCLIAKLHVHFDFVVTRISALLESKSMPRYRIFGDIVSYHTESL
jgi:hypothetical protein